MFFFKFELSGKNKKLYFKTCFYLKNVIVNYANIAQRN